MRDPDLPYELMTGHFRIFPLYYYVNVKNLLLKLGLDSGYGRETI